MPERLTLQAHVHPDHAAWLAGLPAARERDIYQVQVAELAEVRLPGGPAAAREAFAARYRNREPGVWSYYPWLNTVLRTLEPEALFELRTNRNRNLVTASEQSALRSAHVAIAGLSVGSNIMSALAHHGIGSTFSLADHDDLATSNLNRSHARLVDVGQPKCQLAAHVLWELDPFAACILYLDGLDDDGTDQFVAASDIVLDEVDDFRVKVRLRLAAQAHGKPLLMATNLGDSVLIDVERWDQPQDGLQMFNGLLDGVSPQDLMRPGLAPEQAARFAAQVVGVANIPLRALASLPLIGRELAGRPQVASTAGVAAGLAVLAARAVLLGAPLGSGRYRLSIAQVLGLADDLGTARERAAVMAALRPSGAGERPALPDPGTLASDGPAAALARLAVYGVLAPSPHNTQPWQFEVARGALRIAPDATRALLVADPRRRALAISLGCSAMSILVAAAAAGLAMTMEIGPGADVRLAVADGEPDRDLARLFGALASRVTDKRGYPPQPVEPPSVPVPAGIAISYFADPDIRAQVADLHRQAVGELARTNSFSSELAGWLRTDQADPRRDGMTLPMPPGQAGAVIAELARSGEPLRELGERDARALAAGPLVGFLTSGLDDERDWVHTGLAWQRLCLTAHASGLALAPLTAVVEDPHARHAAAALVSPGQHVQMIFRLGTSPGPLSPTARRDPALTTR